jgi:hypothetical protein
MPEGVHSSMDNDEMLRVINDNKKQSNKLIGNAIEKSWIGYANAMELKFQEKHNPEFRTIITMDHLRKALKNLTLAEKIAALYFITGYTRDVLYSQVMYGSTHQNTVEDYVLHNFNATFSNARTKMKPGRKTCLGILYGQVYNRCKHRLQKAILPKHLTMGVTKHVDNQDANWKRPKHIYFVESAVATDTSTTRVQSTKVSTGEQKSSNSKTTHN